MSTITNAARITEAAQRIQISKHKPDVLDLGKRYSYGKNTNTQNFVDEHAKAVQLNLVLTNLTTNLHTVAFGAITSTLNATQYATEAAIKTAIGATAIMKKGKIIDDGLGKELTANFTDSGRDLDEFIKYFSQNPTRIVGMNMVSRNATTGAGENSNFDLKIKQHFVSPFDIPLETEKNLRPLVMTGMNFTQERLNVNFIKEAFQALLSNEHFFSLQIKPNTELSITLYIGAQDSKAQRFYRDIKAADDVLRPAMLGV